MAQRSIYAKQELTFGVLPWTPKASPQLPFKRPQILSNRDHKALTRGTLAGACWVVVRGFGPLWLLTSGIQFDPSVGESVLLLWSSQ